VIVAEWRRLAASLSRAQRGLASSSRHAYSGHRWARTDGTARQSKTAEPAEPAAAAIIATLAPTNRHDSEDYGQLFEYITQCAVNATPPTALLADNSITSQGARTTMSRSDRS